MASLALSPKARQAEMEAETTYLWRALPAVARRAVSLMASGLGFGVYVVKAI